MSSATGGTRPGLAIALAVVGFGALGICGLGVISLVTGRAVLDVPGLGPLPGAIGFGASAGALALVLAVGLRRPHPSFVVALPAVIAAPLAYVFGIAVGGVAGGVDLARLFAAAGGFALSWFAVVLAVAAGVCAWVAVALVRTRSRPPRWGWERDDDE